jgi:tRNA-splicing ligase RtcB
MSEQLHILHDVENGVPIKSWTHGVPVEDAALRQLENTARMPFVFRHVAAMPDVHLGIGATVGSVVPTQGAIIPPAVGVDIGCGMMAVRTSLTASDLPDNLKNVRNTIERAVPHGRSNDGGRHDRGAWKDPPGSVDNQWARLNEGFDRICERVPSLRKSNNRAHLGTLGTGNHFIEMCLDESQAVWLMLHSGSRGVGNAIGSNYIELARSEMLRLDRNLPDRDLAYFQEGFRRLRVRRGLGAGLRAHEPRHHDEERHRLPLEAQGPPALHDG